MDIGYNSPMSHIYLSRDAHPLLVECLNRLGHQCNLITPSPSLPQAIASHPDLFLCKLGIEPASRVYVGDHGKPKSPYPNDAIYNAACTGKYFIHNLSVTDPGLRKEADLLGMIPVHVKQGYTKCNIVILDKTNLITSDKGIYQSLCDHKDINSLLIEPGHVALPGFSTGFIGGASGRVGNQVIFHGALSEHPDFQKIITFIESVGLNPVWFKEFPLTDIGSMIEAPGA